VLGVSDEIEFSDDHKQFRWNQVSVCAVPSLLPPPYCGRAIVARWRCAKRHQGWDRESSCLAQSWRWSEPSVGL